MLSINGQKNYDCIKLIAVTFEFNFKSIYIVTSKVDNFITWFENGEVKLKYALSLKFVKIIYIHMLYYKFLNKFEKMYIFIRVTINIKLLHIVFHKLKTIII